jgi:hypothetical protein
MFLYLKYLFNFRCHFIQLTEILSNFHVSFFKSYNSNVTNLWCKISKPMLQLYIYIYIYIYIYTG